MPGLPSRSAPHRHAGSDTNDVSRMVIRQRTPADDSAIRNLNDAAFRGTSESRLVEDLRAAGLVAVELVAVDPLVDGHILFSVLDVIVDQTPVRTLSLAPVAVRPRLQRQGIGSALVRAGLQRAGENGWQVVVVLGHQNYYPRFGFSAALTRPLEAPFSGASFMAL